MPRQARKESGTGIYHVMLRGINRQDIFEEAEDYMRMLSCLQQMLGRTGGRVPGRTQRRGARRTDGR